MKRFSGPMTADVGALDSSLSAATEVRITRGGYLIYAVDPDADVLAAETAKYVDILSLDVVAKADTQDEVTALRRMLRVSELTGSVCMCAGDLAFEFLDDEGTTVEVVRFDYPDSIQWRMWQGDTRLADPSSLLTWLESHGVTPTETLH